MDGGRNNIITMSQNEINVMLFKEELWQLLKKHSVISIFSDEYSWIDRVVFLLCLFIVTTYVKR